MNKSLLPPLARLPRGTDTGLGEELVILHRPGSARAEDIRRLAKTIALRWFRGSGAANSALTIISAGRQEGRSTLAANLACAFAENGAQTLLVDADHYNPRLHLMLGLDGVRPPAFDPEGVAELATYAVDAVANLAMLPSGSLAGGYDRFNGSAFNAMIESQSRHFDAIFVDTPPATLSNDYQIAARATRGAMLVCREGITRVQPTIKMLNACDDQGITIVGGTMLLS